MFMVTYVHYTIYRNLPYLKFWVFFIPLFFLGDRTPKKWPIKKKIASIEVSTSSGYCCGNLQLCDVCEGGLGGDERHYNLSVFMKCLQEDRSPEKLQFWNF